MKLQWAVRPIEEELWKKTGNVRGDVKPGGGGRGGVREPWQARAVGKWIRLTARKSVEMDASESYLEVRA